MSELDTALDVRAKMLGVLLKDARLYAGRTVKECAEALGLSTSILHAYESGEKSPSLPELEILAFFLEVPLTHFWGNTVLTEKQARETQLPPPTVMELRDRLIGAKLRQARVHARLKIKDFAAELGISTGLLSAFEFGQKSVPLPELEVMVSRLGLSLEDLLENQGQLGEWESAQRLFERFKQLSPDLREFVTQPVNESYLRLAQRLSKMPADQLRSIAAGLLEITY
jgi:transcriptional regulator with XRE-family HTH domain